MEEMAATVRTNSENAQQANQLGINARDVATSGGKVVVDVSDITYDLVPCEHAFTFKIFK